MASPLSCQALLLPLILVVTFCLDSVVGDLKFIPPRHEARLHYNAPPDLLVTTVAAADPSFPDTVITYALHEVHDHKYFRLERETGRLLTKQHVHLRLGKTLSIMVVAMGNEHVVYETMRVRIVEYNRFTPTVDFDIYRSEVTYTVPVDTSLLRVQAHDNDSMTYNAELYYTLEPSNFSDRFSMDLHTGELRLVKSLDADMKQVQLTVLIEDGGSPVRSVTTAVEIDVKTISEPRYIRDRNPTGNSLEICWDRPVLGHAVGYLVRYRESSSVAVEGVRDVNVTKENMTSDGSSFCAELRGLKPWTDYEYRVYAWNHQELGLGSEVTTSSTRSNYCMRQPCQRGRCIPINGDPGFLCDCDRGYYGSTCNLFNACVLKPCGEFGTCHNTSDRAYNCVCVGGFSGENCSVFDPCSIRPPPCENNATCHSVGPGTFRCECLHGFYGKTCNKFNPCLSSPCLHGGTCHNISEIEYKCICVPGFQAKNCEVNINECISNPCQNGGSCIDGTNKFQCNCTPGFTGNVCQKIDFCPEEVTWVEHGAFNWPKSRFGDHVEVPCPAGPFDRQWDHQSAYAIRICTFSKLQQKVAWSPVNSSKCREEGFHMAEKVANELEGLTSDVTNMSSVQFEATTKQIENVVTYALYDKKIAHSMLSVISNMLDVNTDILVNDNASLDASERLVDVVKRFTSSVVVDRGSSVTFHTDNLAVKAINWQPGMQNFTDGLFFQAAPSNRKRRSTTDNDIVADEVYPSITIPEEALTIAESFRYASYAQVRVQFAEFKNAKFFRERNADQSRVLEELDQRVLIASIANVTIANLSTPVTYTMNVQDGNKPYLCTYWKELDKEWAYDGITTNQTDGVVTCQSTHLTAFSVLLDPDPHAYVPKQHRAALSIISYVGCGFSIIGLILTIITYSLFRCLNRDRSGKILLNLCASMLLMNLCFLAGSQSHRLHNIDICVAVAILTHYFLLTTLGWMCVEAVNMYQMLIYVFASSETRFMLKRCFGAWGLPLIIVGATVGIDIAYYHNGTEYCMLSPANPYVYYVTFLGPSCIILLVNSIVFIMVTRVLFQPRAAGKVGQDTSRDQVTLAQVRGAFTVMTLLGVTWVFGALAIGPMKLAFQYLFCILNSLQGFLIFFVRCIQFPEARAAWLQLLKTGTLKKYRGGAAYSSHSQSNGGGGIKCSNAHSRSSRTASADTSSSIVVNSMEGKERRISGTSFASLFRSKSQRRRSSTEDKAQSAKPIHQTDDQCEDETSHCSGSLKEGRDTQWQYYCCAVKRPSICEAKAVTSAPLLGSINTDELPFIEDEQQVSNQVPESASQSDLGYSSAENSPNASRLLQEDASQQPDDTVNSANEQRKRAALLPRHVSPRHNWRNCMPPVLEPILSATNSPAHDLTQMSSSQMDIDRALHDLTGQPHMLNGSHSKSLGALNDKSLSRQQIPAEEVLNELLYSVHSCQDLWGNCSSLRNNRRAASDPQVTVNEDVPATQESNTDASVPSLCDILDQNVPMETSKSKLKAIYDDSFIVSSIEDISYMDASSTEAMIKKRRNVMKPDPDAHQYV